MDLSLVYNPPGDGNCQFGALCFWLNQLGIHRSSETIRKEIVEYLTNHPNNIEGLPLELFAAMPWPEYLEAMARDGTYGDHITLQAAADIYSIEIYVASSLGPDAAIVTSPSASIPIARIHLGHYAEDHREHYVCIDGGVLLSDEEQLEEQQQEDEQEVDASAVQELLVSLPIHFVRDNEDGMVMNGNNDTSNTNRYSLPNEILDIIIHMAISSSGFSWPDHICHVYNKLCNVNSRFRAITQRLVSRLPHVYFSSGGETGIVSVRRLMKQFGPSSGLVLEIQRIISNPKWINAWLKLQRRDN